MPCIRIRLPALLLGLVLLCAGGLRASAAEPMPTQRLRVMSYNIHHGEGTDGKLDLPRIARLIAEQEADIVLLQEVDRGAQRSGCVDQAQQLAALLKMQHIFGKNIDFQGGGYGNATLSRFPIVSTANHHYRVSLHGEQRGLLQAIVTVGQRQLLVLNTHLDYHADDAERLACVGELKSFLDAYERPAVLGGDFNDVPQSKTYRDVAALLDDAWRQVGQGPGFTIPSSEPRRRIDYIWISPASLKPLRSWVVQSEASDHCGLVVELELR